MASFGKEDRADIARKGEEGELVRQIFVFRQSSVWSVEQRMKKFQSWSVSRPAKAGVQSIRESNSRGKTIEKTRLGENHYKLKRPMDVSLVFREVKVVVERLVEEGG